MTRTEFIQRKVADVKATISLSRRWSIALFIVALISIVISRIPNLPFPEEFLKFGLSSMSTISGFALQGLLYIRKNKLLELEYSLGKVDEYESLGEFDRNIIDKALQNI